MLRRQGFARPSARILFASTDFFPLGFDANWRFDFSKFDDVPSFVALTTNEQPNYLLSSDSLILVPLTSGKLSGKVAIVTGGGSGIGRAIAVRFARAGARVVAAGPHLENVTQTAEMIGDKGGEAFPVIVDVSRSEQMRNLTSKALEKYGQIDILVNNAEIFATPIEDLPEHDWDRVIDVNLKGAFLCSQTVGRHMIKRKSGVILNIISISAQIPEP